MLSHLYKQTWLICLMVFAISFSTLSTAYSQVMPMMQMLTADNHAMMQSSQKLETATQQHMLPSSMSAQHCQDMLQSAHTAALSDQQIDQSCAAMSDLSAHCQSCSLSMCQSMSAWLHIEHGAVLNLPTAQQSHAFHGHYQAQHLAGFWQQILRPPKA